jgi:hypothetical protein
MEQGSALNAVFRYFRSARLAVVEQGRLRTVQYPNYSVMTISSDANVSGKLLMVMLAEYRDRGQRRCADWDVRESKRCSFPLSPGSYISQARRKKARPAEQAGCNILLQTRSIESPESRKEQLIDTGR